VVDYRKPRILKASRSGLQARRGRRSTDTKEVDKQGEGDLPLPTLQPGRSCGLNDTATDTIRVNQGAIRATREDAEGVTSFATSRPKGEAEMPTTTTSPAQPRVLLELAGEVMCPLLEVQGGEPFGLVEEAVSVPGASAGKHVAEWRYAPITLSFGIDAAPSCSMD
jgi:hypothetical protein